MFKNAFLIPMVLFLLFLSTPLFSQAKKDTITLSEIFLKSSPIKNVLQKSAAAVSVISTADINKTDGISFAPILNKIPGVIMQQGTANTNRISIRGIGSRSQYATNRIKAYFDGIPITSAEGETVIEDIDLAAIEKIEIIKGPNSSSFGSGMGGVIHLFSKETPTLESYAKYNTTYGSYGLLQSRIAAGHSTEKTSLFTSYSDLESREFRANSAYNRKNFNLFAKQKMATKGTLSFVGIYTKLKAYLPSSLSEKDFINNPERAATTWAAAQGNKSYDKFLMGIGYDHQFSEKWSLNSSVFSIFKDSYEARPFDILAEKTNNLGLRLNLNYKDNLFSMPIELSFGTEIATEKYHNSLYKNLYLSQAGQGSLEGDKFSSNEQNRNYANYFIQMEFWISKNLHVESGLALNTTKYSLKDVFTSNSMAQDYAFGILVSPRIGLSYKVGNQKNIYTSISKGFSVPTVAETLTPTGQINSELKPEIGWNYEIGFKGNWLSNKLYTELALFSAQIENLLVARRTAEDQYVGINAGSSSHLGVEFLVNYNLLNSPNLKINPYISGVLNHFRFKDFVDGDFDYSGNSLTNVPKNQVNFGLDINTKKGWRINTSFRTVGKMPINDANSLYTDAYALLDIKTTYAFRILEYLKTELTAGINNALNEKYAASIVPNALGFGTAPARYYYPGNPVNYYGGFSVSWLF